MKIKAKSTQLPAELMVALEGDPQAAATFHAMPPSHQAEYCTYVREARKTETRQRRAARSLEMIHAWAQDRVKPQAARK